MEETSPSQILQGKQLQEALSQESQIAKPWRSQPRDRLDPNACDALYLDKAIPVDPVAKAYMIRDLQSWTRNYLLIPIKLLANVLLALIMTVKRLLPFQFHAYGLMHKSAAFSSNTLSHQKLVI